MNNLPQLKKRTWELCSQYIRLKYPICQICQKRYSEHVHHICRRATANYLYFDERNLLSLCGNCHNKIHADYKNRKTFEATEMVTILDNLIGREGIEYLEAYRRKIKRWDKSELLDLQAFYKQRIKDLKNDN